MPKKTVDEFKLAFKAVKKPKPPDGIKASLIKDKGALESAISKAIDDNKLDDVIRLANELYEKDPTYMVDLIAYKFVKHFDEHSEKKPLWVRGVPQEAYALALKKVVPNDLSDRLTRVTLDTAVVGKGNQAYTVQLIRERDPEAFTDYAFDKWLATSGEGTEKDAWAAAMGTETPGQTKHLLELVVKKGGPDGARRFAERIGDLRVEGDDEPSGGVNSQPFDHDSFRTLVAKNPTLIAKHALPVLKSKSNDFVTVLSDPALRKLLAAQAPKEWAALVASTPMLSLIKEVEKTIEAKKLATPAAIVGEMFDAIVENRGIPLAYYTVSFDAPGDILTGGTTDLKAGRDAKKKALGDEFPDLPATQCHSLLHLVEDMMGMCPGMDRKPVITQGTVDKMLLTAKLSTMRGKGLLDKSFGGNVFDDAGKSVDQVLFTGNEKGESSHSWVVIDGVPYDPVMGTRGAEVAASVDEVFTWLAVNRVARGTKGRYIIKGAALKPDGSPRTDLPATPKPKGNKMGFGSGYRLTAQPQDFLSSDELEAAGLTGVVPDETGEGA